MGRHRHARPKRQSSALIALVAFPLAFGTVSATLASGPDGGQVPEASPDTSVPYDDLLVTPPRPDLTPAVVMRSRSTTRARTGIIPWSALQAYQRSTGILAEVRPECGLPWTLLAAVGQVESDHGQVGGRELDDGATVQPAMVGPALDGRKGRAKVADTDKGSQDGDRVWDRELGPMRLVPSVWELAGVDGDGDGRRDVQDLDDAALATAVFLCASGEGLHKAPAAAAALLTYRGDKAYVDQVLAVEARYRQGKFAVSASPPMTTVNASLDLGPALPVRELTARAFTDVSLQLGGLGGIPFSERDQGTTEDVVALPPRTRSPEAGPTAGAPTGRDPSPTSPAPGDSGRPSELPEDPSEGDPTTPGPGGPSTPADPTTEPAPGPTEGPGTEEPTDPPTDPPAGNPPADDLPSDDPTGGEGPLPADDPTTALLEGVWAACERGDPPVGGYCLDGALVDLALSGPLDSPATGDLDGDGTVSTVGAELEGLLGRIVKLTVVLGTEPLKVVAVNNVAMAPR